MASWFVRSTLERVVRVWTLAGDIVLCSWARHFTLTVPLSTQVYKMVPANLLLGVTLWWATHPRGVKTLPVPSCYWNWDKLWPDRALSSYADFTYLFYTWLERGTVTINCLSQEHNTTSLARTSTQTVLSGDQHINQEATTMPPNSKVTISWGTDKSRLLHSLFLFLYICC